MPELTAARELSIATLVLLAGLVFLFIVACWALFLFIGARRAPAPRAGALLRIGESVPNNMPNGAIGQWLSYEDPPRGWRRRLDLGPQVIEKIEPATITEERARRAAERRRITDDDVRHLGTLL